MTYATRRLAALPLLSAVLAFSSPTAAAQTNIDLMIKPFEERVPLEFNAGGAAVAAGHTDGDEDYQLSILDLSGRYRFAPDQRIDPRLGVAATFLNFDTDDRRFPTTLLDASIAVGFGVYEDKASGWQGGVTIGGGYAGATSDRDNLFSDSNAWYPKASFVIGRKISKTDGLLFVVDYDANRTYKPDIPFPGVAYQKLIFGNPNPTEPGGQGPFEPQLLLTIGVPYASLHWEPIDRLSIDMSYLIPDDFSLKVDYDLLRAHKLGVFAALDYRRNAFHWNELRHGDDRVIFYQRHVEVGLRWTPTPKFNLLAAAGYAFAQELTTGFDSTDDDKLADLGDRPYVRLALQFGF